MAPREPNGLQAPFYVQPLLKEVLIAFHHRSRPREPQVRTNNQIRLSPVRLIGPDGEQVGVVPIEEARALAREHDLDLVEVDPNSRPIVCKVLDWGRAKYELAKKEKVAKRHEKTLEIKQVKFRPGVSDHDFKTKLNHARRFLEDGRRTKVTMMFRRRDLRRPENGRKVLVRVMEALQDVAKVETLANRIENRDLTMVLVPKVGVGHTTKAQPPRPPKTSAPARRTEAAAPAPTVNAETAPPEPEANEVAAAEPRADETAEGATTPAATTEASETVTSR